MAFIEASLEELPVSAKLGQSCLATKISAPGPSSFGWFRHSAMGDGVHATVSVEQPITVQDQSSQTAYHPKNGEKACPCCQFYGVPCRQVRATEDEATTRRNQRLFSSTKKKRSHQEQLAEDSLFLDSPSVDELQTI